MATKLKTYLINTYMDTYFNWYFYDKIIFLTDSVKKLITPWFQGSVIVISKNVY